MKRGPVPKPVELKLLHGEQHKERLNENRPRPKPVAPAMPAWLAKDAKAEWKRLVPMLLRLGVITEADGMALAALCQSWARYVQAERELKGTLTNTFKTGYKQQKAEVGIVKSYLTQLRAFCAEFGLTPSARGRIQVPGEPEEDEFGEFLN